MVFDKGYDGLIYSMGFWLAGRSSCSWWLNVCALGKYTFADVASYRLQQTPVRSLLPPPPWLWWPCT
jgi:cation/acetate symporter